MPSFHIQKYLLLLLIADE